MERGIYIKRSLLAELHNLLVFKVRKKLKRIYNVEYVALMETTTGKSLCNANVEMPDQRTSE